MSRAIVNGLLLAALVVTLVLNSGIGGGSGRPNFEYFPDMAHSPRYNTFEANPNFPDGKTLQAPLAGTIPIDADLAPQVSLDATNPLSPTDTAAVARGEVVFATFCEPCHGKTGAGDGLVVKRGYPPPPTLKIGATTEMKDGAIFRLISRGRSDMPAYGSQIGPGDRWKVIVYLRTLQERGGAK